MTDAEEAFAAIFDQALLFHGFTDYLRDYELIVARPAADGSADFLRVVFRNCVAAEVATGLRPGTWRASLGEPSAGFDWSVRWQNLYPGGRLVPGSGRARRWSDEVGIEFSEARIETGVHDLTLVFSGVEVAPVEPGYRPFVLVG